MALNKALELLESVRNVGENEATWNMRMAYAHQYLPGQKEQALAYAKNGLNWIRKTKMHN